MPEIGQLLPHLLIRGYVDKQDFTRQGRGNFKIRDVERRSHGVQIRDDAENALSSGEASRPSFDLEELESLGVVITIEGARGFPLKLESLESQSGHKRNPRPRWLLLSVLPETDDEPERAQVWVADEFRKPFMDRFERFINEDTRFDKPKNLPLVANMARIRQSVLEDLWQTTDAPPKTGRHWWEIWLQPTSDAVELATKYSDAMGLTILQKSLRLDNRHVVWIQATWEELCVLPLSAVPVTELRRPVFVDTIEDLDDEEQDEYVYDLADRLVSADDDAPAVCLLDTGVRRSHTLLAASLSIPPIGPKPSAASWRTAPSGRLRCELRSTQHQRRRNDVNCCADTAGASRPTPLCSVHLKMQSLWSYKTRLCLSPVANTRCANFDSISCPGRSRNSKSWEQPTLSSGSPCLILSSRQHRDEAGDNATRTPHMPCDSTSVPQTSRRPNSSDGLIGRLRVKRVDRVPP